MYTDQIIGAIHVLWERGWEVTPASIQEMLRVGSHIECPLSKIEAVHTIVTTPSAREEWLSVFNQDSTFARNNPRPWPIDSAVWKHQQIEQAHDKDEDYRYW